MSHVSVTILWTNADCWMRALNILNEEDIWKPTSYFNTKNVDFDIGQKFSQKFSQKFVLKLVTHARMNKAKTRWKLNGKKKCVNIFKRRKVFGIKVKDNIFRIFHFRDDTSGLIIMHTFRALKTAEKKKK